VGGPVRFPHRLAATCQPTTTANGSRSGGVALLRPSRSALRRSELGHGHGQAIGARMHGSAPWKTEKTIVGLSSLLVLSAFSRSDSPDLVAVTFHLPGGCHLSPSTFHLPKRVSWVRIPSPPFVGPPHRVTSKGCPVRGAFSVNTLPDPVHVPLREGLVQDLLRRLPKPHIPGFTLRS